MGNSLITSEVDLNVPGKHTGFLRVPHSVHRSAYGWIPVPIAVFCNGAGPTVLMMAGVHGDEYEGQIALTKLVQELAPQDIQGRLIVITIANSPAGKAGTRTSPLDGGNLNRAFPGAASGTPTEMIAHYIESELLPHCDYMIDLHSGGSSLFYPPTLLRGMGHSADETQALRTLQDAFDLPYAWVFTSGGGRQSTARTAMGAANRNGVVSVMAELGGAGVVTPEILALTERGLRRILHSLDMLPDYQPDQSRGTREVHAAGSIFARDAGVFEPFKDIGDTVHQDEEVGRIQYPEHPWRPPMPVHSPYDGFVLCKRALGQVETGDAVYQIATDAA